jgi:hypothetical protein
MAQRTTLTEAQVAVLRWVGDGCPSGVMENDFHRISAAALRNRGLVTTAGRGATWTAEITPSGREYLEWVDGPSPPVPRQANVPVTQQLVEDVIAAGGSLRVPRASWQNCDGVDFERRAQLAQRHGRVPPGKRLNVTVASRDELEIELVDAPGHAGGRAELVPISVPEKVGRYHPAARQFRGFSERHEVSRAQLPRATRIIHTIAVEAERRGWSAQASSESKNGYGRSDWTGTKDGHLLITAGGYDFRVRLQEEGVHTRGRWEEEVARYRDVSPDSYFYRDRQLPRGPYDARGTGRLKLELHAGGRWTLSGRQSRWADRPSWMLESRLSYVLREIEERIVEVDHAAEQQRIAAEKAADAARRAAEEREQTWRVLMQEAEKRLVESSRAARLREQSEAWRTTQALRQYCVAIEAAHGDRPETAEWVAWVRGYISRLDPLATPPEMPENPEVTPEALQPHLPDGWSALGPDQRAAPWSPLRT